MKKMVKNPIGGGKILSLILAAVMLMSIITAVPVTAYDSYIADDELNEAGLKLVEIMEEYADCPLMTEFLEDYKARNIDELTGYNPYIQQNSEVDYDLLYCDIEEVEAPAQVEMNVGMWANPLELDPFVRLMSANNDNIVPCCCLEWELLIVGTVPNHTITINAPGRAGARSVVRVPSELRPNQRLMPGVPYRPVTRIGDGVFAYSFSQLTTLTFERVTPPAFGANVFAGNINLTSIRVPFESVVRYRNLPALSAFRNRITGGCVVRPSGIRPPHLCNCRFRLGDVNGNASIDVNDALRVIQFDIGSSSTNIVLNPPNNALFASLISNRARIEGRPRQLDAEVIMDNVVRLPNCIDRNCRLPCSICRR